jgi:Arc/MetJ family transcription regulator
MRTTIDLPDDLHRVATAIARDQGTSLSEAVAMLLRRAIGTAGDAEVITSERTGLDVIRLGRAISNEDVRSLDDES